MKHPRCGRRCMPAIRIDQDNQAWTAVNTEVTVGQIRIVNFYFIDNATVSALPMVIRNEITHISRSSEP